MYRECSTLWSTTEKAETIIVRPSASLCAAAITLETKTEQPMTQTEFAQALICREKKDGGSRILQQHKTIEKRLEAVG